MNEIVATGVQTVVVSVSSPVSSQDVFDLSVEGFVFSYPAKGGDTARDVMIAFMQAFVEAPSPVVAFNVVGDTLQITASDTNVGFTVRTSPFLLPNIAAQMFLVAWDRDKMTATVQLGKYGTKTYTVSIDTGITDPNVAITAIGTAVKTAITAERTAQNNENAKPDLDPYIGRVIS